VCVCSSITLERLERFQPNLDKWTTYRTKDSPEIWMIRIVEEIKLLLLYNLLYIYINWLMYVVGVIEEWDN
jgi:hypothetical protein